MLSLDHMLDHAVVTTDGRLGHLFDAYYDDRFWTVRYLVVSGIGEEEVTRVVSTIAVDRVDAAARQVFLSIGRELLMGAPDFSDIKPVSVEMEANYFNYFGWPHYWRGLYGWGTSWAVPAAPAPAPQLGVAVPPVAPPEEEAEAERGPVPEYAGGTVASHHLRSARETTGYHVQALDGEIGHIEDFIVEPRSWRIAQVVVDTRNWWFGKKVAVPAETFTRVDWESRLVFVDETREQVKERREFDVDRLRRGA